VTETQASALVSSLFGKWYSSLVRYAARFTGNVDLAEDLTQEVFLRLYRELRQSREIRNPKAWTLCVLRHEIGRAMRTQERYYASQATAEALENLPAADFETIGSLLEIDQVTRLFSVLTPREEEVILLRLASLKYREIAERLGISPSSVNTLLARALRKLQHFAKKRPERYTVVEKLARYAPKTLQ